MRKLSWAMLPILMSLTSMAIADEASDKQISKKIRAVFRKHPDVCTGVGARTKDGVVYLSGATSTPYERDNAEALAKSVPGVEQVVDELYVEN
jgi:osmotically-inducible protein OsmY